jgi:hypothetical protein
MVKAKKTRTLMVEKPAAHPVHVPASVVEEDPILAEDLVTEEELEEELEAEAEAEEQDEDEEPQQPVAPAVVKTFPFYSKSKVLPKRVEKTSFTVILQEAQTMVVGGQKYHLNQPTEVPIEKYKMFKDNGWFRVVV